MAVKRTKSEDVRRFILSHVSAHKNDIASYSAEHFGISRQAVGKHLQSLVADKKLIAEGERRSRIYKPAPIFELKTSYKLDGKLQEDVVWRNDIAPKLHEQGLPNNVMDILQYGFTEMLNNAIDHSGGKVIIVTIKMTTASTKVNIMDDGEGIFRKLVRKLNLEDEHHAILELSKGKLTTDPTRHSGEGIFFTSNMFDYFVIYSHDMSFSHRAASDKYWALNHDDDVMGTGVYMELNNGTTRTTQGVFNKFTSDEEFTFSKTVVPVRLARYGDEQLISRSQAKRLLARFERFKVVVLNFEGIDTIGQPFADEVFRVFANMHPEIEILEINAKKAIKQMISRAQHQ